MKYAIIAAPVILVLVVMFAPIHSEGAGELDGKWITASTADSGIRLEFADSAVSGTLIKDGKTLQIENPILRSLGSKTFIIDRSNDLKIVFKNIADGKYLIVAKIEQDVSRFVAKDTTGQRDLREEIRQRNEQKQAEHDAKEQKEQERQAIQRNIDKKVNDINERERASQNNRTTQDILDAYKKYRQEVGADTARSNSTNTTDTSNSTSTNNSTKVSKNTIKAFMKLPRTIEWKEEFIFSVLVTDGGAFRYNIDYGTNVGNTIRQVLVESIITSPSGEILDKNNGTIDNSIYQGSWVVPENISPRGEYKLSINASKMYTDGYARDSISDVFFVRGIESDGRIPQNYTIVLNDTLAAISDDRPLLMKISPPEPPADPGTTDPGTTDPGTTDPPVTPPTSGSPP